MTTNTPDCPNPGSTEARDAGCTCPVMDNNHGKYPPFSAGTLWGGDEGSWWIAADCPVHANPEPPQDVA